MLKFRGHIFALSLFFIGMNDVKAAIFPDFVDENGGINVVNMVQLLDTLILGGPSPYIIVEDDFYDVWNQALK